MDPIASNVYSDCYHITADLTTKTLTIKEIENKLLEIKALQIELICMKIVNLICSRLGAPGKAAIELELMEKKGIDPETVTDPNITVIFFLANKAFEDGKENFFSEEQKATFLMQSFNLMYKELSTCFSMPQKFIEEGENFILCQDYRAEGVLEMTLDKMNLELTRKDLPSHYNLRLKLDLEESMNSSKLVFCIFEEKRGENFSEIKFTVDELENDFENALNELVLKKRV